ncbi:MAG: LPS export ABC transporter ATP-binding protein [Planctomycetaceae bacterium]|jgi:lipopolysaccharide export system ATP-binding protein|nr:LPS export ABC transporter ATP-binding protein [Planctomycetaceae bacterium]
MSDLPKNAAPILNVEGLIKIYGTRRVVDGVSFHVNHGEIVGLLGPNGAGKTTSFRMACGLISTNGGMVYLGSQNVTDWAMYKRCRDGGLGYLPQDRSVFQKLTVQNNLIGIMEMIGIKRAERKVRCDELLEKFHLTHLRHSYGGSLSGGERRRLEIARSLVSNPKIILLDEPFAAIDPVTVAGIQEIIRNLAAEGISILITDHSVQDTLEITQRSYVVQAGKVLCHGTPDEVLANPEARKVYFGENVSRHAVTKLPDSSRPSAEPPAVRHSPFPVRRRPVDPEWEVPNTEVVIKEKTERHEPISAGTKPFHLQFHSPAAKDTDAGDSPPVVEIRTAPPVESPPVPLAGGGAEKSGIRRLKPIASSITPDVPPEEAKTPDDPGMSSIIRNLGQLVWKNK